MALKKLPKHATHGKLIKAEKADKAEKDESQEEQPAQKKTVGGNAPKRALTKDEMPYNMDVLLGNYNGMRYEEKSAEQYRKSWANQNLADLQMECIRVGLRPTDNRDRMVEALVKEFDTNHATYAPLKTQAAKAKPVNKSVAEHVKEFLSYGGGANVR